jgi:hypothetical protein
MRRVERAVRSELDGATAVRGGQNFISELTAQRGQVQGSRRELDLALLDC